MNREEAVAVLKKIKVAKCELDRMMSGVTLPCATGSSRGDWTHDLKKSISGNSHSRFFPLFAPLHEIEPSLQSSAASHAVAMQYVIRTGRARLSSVTAYNPVRTSMGRAMNLANSVVERMANRRSKVEGVYCKPSTPPVDGKLKMKDAITVPPMWKRDVYDAGISVAKMGTKEVFIVRAKRRASAYLAEDGIMAWDAYAYAPDGTRFHGEGFVFKSDGDHGIVVFNTDFIRGAGTIKKLIFNAVMKHVAA